ncbi:MAG: RHS repeat-associated core domain-containing protein, partial [Actinomycetales bacterium]|nr:RHS repeat-associated core domain-containing protein [Actinomycetales bacterium]
PAFFTRKRLTGVRSEVWDAAASTPGYRSVDSWALTQLFLDPGDIGSTADQVLWLSAIRQTNTVDGAVATPPVRFAHTFLPNRVDATDDILPLTKPRISMITTETGAVVTVNYSDEQCVRGSRMPSAPDSNTMRCFPVYWTPNGVEDPVLDWFHKYVVTHVMVDDPTGGSPTMQTDYSYAGGGAWHHADDPISKVKHRTWSQWRGYEQVTTTTGDPDDSVRSQTVSVFLRGMDGDTKADGSKRSVKVTGIHAPAITDADQYAGQERESVTYNGAGGAEVSGSITTPWSRQTASHAYPGYTAKAFLVRTGSTQDRTVITSGASTSTRTRTTTTTYDDHGMPVTEQDNGDDAVTGDETCTRTWYARNPGKGITALTSRVQTLAVACADVGAASLPATSATSGDVISDTATAYDTTTWSASQTPTLGNARWTGRVKSYAGTTPSWQKISASTYDALGRPLTFTDTAGNATTTAYTPTGAGPVTAIKVTDAKGHITTTALDPAWNQPVKIVDANNKLTELTYDELGRTTQVWLPTASRVIGNKPNLVYGYAVSATKPSWVSTGTIRGDSVTYNTSYTLYDAHLRSRQVQSPSPVGGRVIAETFYDDRGLAGMTYADVYDDTSTPNGTLMATVNAQAPSETRTVFDGAQRPTTSTFLVAGVTKWSTTTSYTGDSVASTAVTGGSATREISDVFGRVIERRQYSGTSPTASTYLKTSFTYTPDGEQESVTGPDGARWTYGYDLFGRQTKTSDPDKGTTTTSYTALDQVESTTDAAGNTLLYSYDELGRKTGQWKTTRSDATKQAAWTYDTLAKGQPTSTTRYVGGTSGSAYTTRVTAYDNAYRATKQQLLLPSSDPLVTAGVPATLSFSTAYNRNGTLKQRVEPAVGGLPLEAVTPKYNVFGLPTTMGGASGYVQNTAYSPLGQVDQVQLGRASQFTNPKQVWITNTYEPGTKRLTRANVTDATNPWMAQDLNYSYDQAGNVTAISDPTTLGGTGKADHQCFGYDGYQRMTEAWTPATAECTTSKRTTANLGGAAPYWTSYTYNDAGLRTTQTQHAVAGTTVTAYGYDPAKTHQLTKTTTTKPDGTTTTTGYSYDALGNTTTRPGTQGTQTLTWDAEGHLATSAEPAKGSTPAKNTGYLYDADGNLLIRRATGDGDTILYLGATEVRLTVKGTTTTLSGTRYYSHAGTTVAVRTATKGTTGTKLTWQVADHHGTAHLAIDSDTQAVTKRYTTPFGAPRGTNPAWVDDKTFLGKPTDTTTGLTHIGAREYDPLIGRFISVDPVMNTTKPLSLNGYTYTENNPVTIADPTGLDGSCPYPSGSAQFKACNSYASSPNGMLTKSERKQRTAERNKQIRDENYNACRSGQGGCGGGGGPESSKPKPKKKHWWDTKIWDKTSSFVQKISPIISTFAFAAAVVLMVSNPAGWIVTALTLVTYAGLAVDGAAAVVGAVEGLKAANITGDTHDGTAAVGHLGSAALSAVGLGFTAKAFKVGKNALPAANRAADVRAQKIVGAMQHQSKGAPFADPKTPARIQSNAWNHAMDTSLRASGLQKASLTAGGTTVTGLGLWWNATSAVASENG